MVSFLLGAGALPLNLDFSSIHVPGASGSQSAARPSNSAGNQGGMSEDPATIREMLRNSPHDLAILKERNPPLAEALLSGSLGECLDFILTKRDYRIKKKNTENNIIMWQVINNIEDYVRYCEKL